MKLKYATSGSPISEPYLFGEKIFDCDWFYLGKEIEIETVRFLQTNSGRMMFARIIKK